MASARILPTALLLTALFLTGALLPVPDTASASTAAASASASDLPPEDVPGYPWRWPVDGGRRVAEPFRAPAHDYGAGHRGMDLTASPGIEVRAPAAGIVAFRGSVVDRPLMTIDHGDGFVTTLEPVQSTLAPGTPLAAGDVVGIVSTGGHARPGTVHIGVRRDGRYVNPRGLFGAVPRAVLLPCCDR